MSPIRLALMTCMAACPGPAAAEDAFGARVRDYLLAHPEVIMEALTILSERERKAALAARIAAFPELFAAPPRLGLGHPDAPVRVVEFFDYRCQPCKAMHPVLEAFVAAHPQVRLEMRHLPILSPGSERAARFALAVREVAGDDAHARVHDRLWALRGPLDAAAFERIAVAEGLDFAPIEAAMEGDAVSARIAGNRDIAVALELHGTPAFVTPDDVALGLLAADGLAARWLSR